MNVKDWDTQVELARTAVETAFQVADEMADRIEVLEEKLSRALEALRLFTSDPVDMHDICRVHQARHILAGLEETSA
jgi:gamma-glutamylcysteine synthetase